MAAGEFAEILAVLARHDVHFVVVGGVAAVLWGCPVVTFDLDVLHSRTPENVDRLLSALSDLEARYRGDPRNLSPERSHLLGPGHQLLLTKHGPLDVLGTIEESTVFEDVVEQAIPFDLAGSTILVLSLERVIASKERSGRPKDLAALPLLKATLTELARRGERSE